jgi:gluconate 2-dehydrogenase gamma chain
MITSADGPEFDRRSLLRGAILLVGGSLAGISGVALAASPDARFFSAAEYAILAEVAEIIIPRTDTPGAKDAGVPEALDSLMANWASASRKAEFRALIQDFAAAGVLSGPTPRADVVRRIDAERLFAGEPIYRRFKELVLTLYYLSEAGATQELRYELVPGKWEPATVIGTDTRAWAV